MRCSMDRAACSNMRRMLLQAARSIGQGVEPPGTGSEYYKLRAIDKVLPSGVQWQQKLKSEIYGAPQYA